MNSCRGSKDFVNGLAMLVIMAISACTTTKAVEMTPEQLQQNIINGGVIDRDDMVNITTRDGSRHCCWVHSITDNSVFMKVSAPGDAHADDYAVEAGQRPQATAAPVEIAISDIVAVDKTELTAGGKAATGAVGLGALAGFWYLIFILLPVAIVGI